MDIISLLSVPGSLIGVAIAVYVARDNGGHEDEIP